MNTQDAESVRHDWPTTTPIDWLYVKSLLAAHRPVSLRAADLYTSVGEDLHIDDDTVRRHFRRMRREGVLTRTQQRVWVALTTFLQRSGLHPDLARIQPATASLKAPELGRDQVLGP